LLTSDLELLMAENIVRLVEAPYFSTADGDGDVVATS
jgi:hypothetical protein